MYDEVLQKKEKKVLPNRARGYKTFLMLNSTEHDIFTANKYTNIKKFSFF